MCVWAGEVEESALQVVFMAKRMPIGSLNLCCRDFVRCYYTVQIHRIPVLIDVKSPKYTHCVDI